MTTLHQKIANVKTLVDRIDTRIVLGLIIMIIGQNPLRCVHILKIREKNPIYQQYDVHIMFLHEKKAHVPHCSLEKQLKLIDTFAQSYNV